MTLRIKRLSITASIPRYSNSADAGLDLFAAESLTIGPGETRCVGTGIAIELPAGTEGQVRPRSGMALKHSVTVLNSPGTIDQGYRGEIGVILINHGKAPFDIVTGMRIAQLVVAPVLRVAVTEVAGLSSSDRGERGFGSTDD
jgi:dUTP pyrophosphatase